MVIEVLLGLNLVLGVFILIKLSKKSKAQEDNTEHFAALKAQLENQVRLIGEEGAKMRAEQGQLNSNLRMELGNSISALSDSLTNENRNNRKELSEAQDKLSQALAQRMQELISAQQTGLDTLRNQINKDSQDSRSELSKALTDLSESLTRRMQDLVNTQQNSFETLKDALEKRMEQIRTNNESKLEEMRRTVDEKLHETLEKRLGDSFKLVSERLEEVHKGLGEMKNLASGVGDLKKVLSNVNTRGLLGEVQLGNILEQMLSAEQYVRNYKPSSRSDVVVEYAIRLPGRDEDSESVYLPIDSKFPIADYHKLVDATEAGDFVQMEASRKALLANIRSSARDIRDKYIKPPKTTDFALLFLPLEGLYAEVLRDYTIFEELHSKHHVIVVGPSTTAALLNSLQVGFRTLAIEKRSSEVWKLLGAVKNEFGKFGEHLERTQKKLQEASNAIGKVQDRSRQIEKKLGKVETLPDTQVQAVLEYDPLDAVPEPEDDLA